MSFFSVAKLSPGGALVPHHAMAVSSACARAGKKLPLEVLQTVREALCCLVAVVTAGVARKSRSVAMV